jgi:AraC family transcriptional regulator
MTTSERRVPGGIGAYEAGVHDMPSLAARPKSRTKQRSRTSDRGGARPEVSPDEVLTIAAYLMRLPEHESWSGGRPLHAQAYSPASMQIANMVHTQTAHLLDFRADAHAGDAVLRRMHGMVDPVLAHLAAALRPAFTHAAQADPAFIGHIVCAARAHLAAKYGGWTPRTVHRASRLTPAQLRRAKELLTDFGGSSLLADVARACGLSRQYFTKAFKATTGVTPHRWLQLHRVEAAKRLLADSTLPIVDIAIKCGFADQSHLTRVFTNIVGTSPARWRRDAPHN